MSETKACACRDPAPESELMARLDQVLAESKGRSGALIPVLQMAQGIFGYVPEKAVRRIALALGKSYSEVAGVVGFYAFFATKPRGKHLIRVCLGTACYVRGAKDILETFKKELGVELGDTTPDGLFTLEVVRCIGACGLGPAVNVGDDTHQLVRPRKVREILDLYRKGAPAAAKEAK